jgi:amino acid transporter
VVVVTTILNLRGIRATARANMALLAVMTVVIVAFLALAVRYLVSGGGWGCLFSYKPFYDPKTFHLQAVGTATSLAAVTYIGFDGVTTLTEEVHDPKRSVLVAVVMVCFLTGLFSTVEVYLAQLVWPDYSTFRDLDSAFLDVTGRVGGAGLFQAMALVLVVACLGSGLAGQAGAARLLYGMGRENVLPRRLFGHLSPKMNIPNYNIVLIAALTLAAVPLVKYEQAVPVLNFGAFLAFMGVNLAAISEYYVHRREGKRRIVGDLLVPGLGFLFCLAIWLSLPRPAKIAGGAWILIGLIYDAIRSRGFRVRPAPIDFGDS